MVNAERLRLDEADAGEVPWRRWGPYLSEWQWGTVREDFGSGADTWSYFSHDRARSRAYRWGEDGLAGLSDDRQQLCLALGLWNGRDPILKERLFGLTNAEGNHGEDVKECYFYLDATPTSSYLKMLYKYPHADFPYADLIAVNGARGKSDPEYELLDTGIGGERPSLSVVPDLRRFSAVQAEHSELGVWARSPDGVALANANAELQESFAEALPDLRQADVIGSPYYVRRYAVDAGFGGPDALAAARAALTARGAWLILDYVPNHVAPDHPWVTSRPELFVRGDADDIKADPAGWMTAAGQVLAHGRDPYFPPWPDVFQLDAFAPALRAATADVLADIAGQCDGIRCDMAMLMTNQVVARTWSGRTGPAPDAEFWPAVLGKLRARHPETVMIAEAYWDMGWALQQQGFDFCYDKRLYDRIISREPSTVRDHLHADLSYQSRLMRFLDNHDEPRIASCLRADAERAAAVAIATLPGATLWHEGQFEGRRVRPPVFLSRRPDEVPDVDLASWYRRLLAAVGSHQVRAGAWRPLQASGWPDNQSCRNIIAWSWAGDRGGDRYMVAVSFPGQPAQARIPLDWPDLPGRSSRFTDILSQSPFERDGAGLASPGLFVDLGPWQFHLLAAR